MEQIRTSSKETIKKEEIQLSLRNALSKIVNLFGLKEKLSGKRTLDGFKVAEEWIDSDFDVEKRLKELKGPMIEIAGPTEEGYDLVDLDNFEEKFNKKFLVSNVFHNDHAVNRADFAPNKITVDFQASASALPIKNNVASAIFCSCLGSDAKRGEEENRRLEEIHRKEYSSSKEDGVKDKRSESEKEEQKQLEDELRIQFWEFRAEVMKEAWRALEEKGLLVWQKGRKDDAVLAEESGFKMVQKMKEDTGMIPRYYYIFEKNKEIKNSKENISE